MAQVYKKLNIDINSKVNDIITAVQNDANSRFLDVSLYDGAQAVDLTGCEVRIYGKKHDGTEFYNNGQITNAAAGRCQFELTSQALAVANDLEVQIIIYENNIEILSTLPFVIHVVKSLISDGAVESSNEYGALVLLYQNLYEAYDLMTEMVQKIGVPQEKAEELNLNTMFEVWDYIIAYLEENSTAGVVDVVNNIANIIGTTTDKGGSETAGTVMGKLNKLFNIGSQIVYPSIENTLTLLSNATICNAVPSAATYWTLGVPVKVKSDGLVRIKLNLKYRYSSASSTSTDVGKLKFGVARCGGDITLDNASILDLASGTAITDSSLIPSERDTLTIAYVDTSTHAVEYEKMLKVNKGDVLVFYGYTYTNCNLYTVNNLSIQYAKMEGEI